MQCYNNRNYSWSFFVILYQKTGSGPTQRDGIIKSCKHECENHEDNLKSVEKGRGLCLSGDILQWCVQCSVVGERYLKLKKNRRTCVCLLYVSTVS